MASSTDDDDPIVATFDIVLRPALAPDARQLYILQYPNRATDNPANLRNPDLESLRIKPKTGMVEVDVPLNPHTNYDKKKGVAWGSALRKSMDGKGASGSLGLPGGFGVNSAPGRRGRPGPGATAAEGGEQAAWAEALRTNNVLSTQTLGGMNVPERNARHAVAVFQGGKLHLTPVSNLVHLRPALHHLDAMAEQERASRPPAPGQTGPGKDGGGAKAIHMTIKSAMGDEEVIETMKDRLKAVQQEKWKRFEYVHDESEAAWDAYNDALLATGSAAAAAATDDKVMLEDGSGAAKGKDLATTLTVPDGAAPVVRLEGTWDEGELLRVVGGQDEEDAQALAAAAEKLDIKERAKIKKEAGEDNSSKRRSGRPAKGDGASTQKKGAKGKAIEID